MVEYRTWISIGHEVYKAKGGGYGSQSDAPQVTSTLAEYWQANTDDLRSASESEARQIAQSAMSV